MVRARATDFGDILLKKSPVQNVAKYLNFEYFKCARSIQKYRVPDSIPALRRTKISRWDFFNRIGTKRSFTNKIVNVGFRVNRTEARLDLRILFQPVCERAESRR